MENIENYHHFRVRPIADAISRCLAYSKMLGLLSLGITSTAMAAEEMQDQFVDGSVVLEKIIVTDKFSGMRELNASEMEADILTSKRAGISDTAKLLEDTAGVSLYSGGGVSALPAIHGLNDDRVKITVNGMTISSACANHMNPPLSYIDRSNIGKITILTGISPVSLGGDSIGGTITVATPEPVFAEPGKDILVDGSISAFYRSNGDAFGGSIAAGVATQNVRLEYTGSHTESMNYSDGTGTEVKSTYYENQNHSAALSFKIDNHLVVIRGGQQHIPRQGFPNQRMDMTNNDSIFANITHKGMFDWGTLESKFYYESTNHSMDIAEDKHRLFGGVFNPPNDRMPMETRGQNLGGKIQAEILYSERDTFRVGTEVHSQKLDDYWPAVHTNTGVNPTTNMAYWMMAPEAYDNINNGERNRVGFFGEWEAVWNDQWKSLFGLRYDRVMMDADNVQPYNPNLYGTNNIPGTMPYNMAGARTDLRASQAFNGDDRERNYDLFDITALVQYTPNDMSQFEFGYARKNRAPNLYELYVWGRRPMDMGMIGWFGDGNGYMGNRDLTEETANTVSFTMAFHDPKSNNWEFAATPYFTYVNNFIDVDPCTSTLGALDMACNAGTQGVPGNYQYLQFANHDARLWGIDVSGRAQLYKDKTFGEFATHTTMSYVRGERMDGGNLYKMMPFNMKVSLDHRWHDWQSAIEMQFVDSKDHVQAIRNETRTPSYILLNARTGYEWGPVRIDVGLDNVLDKQYFHPLAGAYLGDRYGMNPTTTTGYTVPWGRNIPGMGRSMFVGVTIKY